MNTRNFLILLVMLIASNVKNYVSAKSDTISVNSTLELQQKFTELLASYPTDQAVLVIPLEMLMRRQNKMFYSAKQQNFNLLIEKLASRINANALPYTAEFILTEYPHEVDTQLINLLKMLQSKGITILVITTNSSGAFNNIQHLEVWSVAYLKKHGLDLQNSRIGMQQIIFNKNFRKLKGAYPTLYHGLLSCSSYQGKNSRQIILANLFAQQLQWWPKVLYVIDQNEAYLNSLHNQFYNLNRQMLMQKIVLNLPEKDDLVQATDFYNFWSDLITKLNKLTRGAKKLPMPYEE